MTSQWKTLECYARWKGNLRWNDLPDDIVYMIAGRLNVQDVLALVDALVNDPLGNPHLVPSALWRPWLRCISCEMFKRFLNSGIAEEVLYDTRNPFTSTVILLDWSKFSRQLALPVAEISWRMKRTHVDIHEARFLAEVDTHETRRLPVVRVTLHRVMYWNGERIINPEPVKAIEHTLIPPNLLRSSSERVHNCLRGDSVAPFVAGTSTAFDFCAYA